MRRTVEPEGEKHDIGCGQQRCFRKIGASEEAHDESELERRRDPSQNMGRGETRRRDGGRRCVDVRQLEAHRHNKERGKDEASYEDRRRRPSCPIRFRRHVPLLLIANLEALYYALPRVPRKLGTPHSQLRNQERRLTSEKAHCPTLETATLRP